MLRPTTGELLDAVHVQLTDQVLPTMPDGTPRRQLKAALHILRRLEHAWDQQGTHLQADNADLVATLDKTLRILPAETGFDYSQSRIRLDQIRNQPPDLETVGDEAHHGMHDPELRRVMATNHALQQTLADLQDMLHRDHGLTAELRTQVTTMISGLHRRMLHRAAKATGTEHDH